MRPNRPWQRLRLFQPHSQFDRHLRPHLAPSEQFKLRPLQFVPLRLHDQSCCQLRLRELDRLLQQPQRAVEQFHRRQEADARFRRRLEARFVDHPKAERRGRSSIERQVVPVVGQMREPVEFRRLPSVADRWVQAVRYAHLARALTEVLRVELEQVQAAQVAAQVLPDQEEVVQAE